MRLYSHARQFPHLQGLSTPEIRALARRGLNKQPHLRQLMRYRNVGVVMAMLVAYVLLTKFSGLSLGLRLMIVGGASTAFVLAWNFVWVNVVIYRVTKGEVQQVTP